MQIVCKYSWILITGGTSPFSLITTTVPNSFDSSTTRFLKEYLLLEYKDSKSLKFKNNLRKMQTPSLIDEEDIMLLD